MDESKDGPVRLKAVAGRLGLTQTGLKTQLGALAAVLGFEVIEKVSGGWKPTPEGRKLRNALERYHDAAVELVDRTDAAPGKQIRLTCTAGNLFVLHEALATTDLDLRPRFVDPVRRFAASSLALRNVANYASDIAIATRQKEADMPPGVRRLRKRLYQWELAAVAGPNDEPLEGRCRPKDLEGRRLLVSPPHHQSRVRLEAAAVADGAKLSFEVETAMSTARWFMSRAGVGTIVAPTDALYFWQPGVGGARIIDPATSKTVGDSYFLYCREDDPNIGAYRDLAGQFRDVAERWVRLGHESGA